MSCEDIRPDLVALLDGELSAARRQAVEEHLAACEDCRRLRQGYQLVREALAGPAAAEDAGLAARVLDSVRSNTRRRPWRERLRWLVPAAALAAGALLAALWPGRPPPEAGLADPVDELEIAADIELYDEYELIADLDVLSDLEAIESLQDEG